MTQKKYQSFFHADFCGIAQLVQNVLLPALTLNQESYTNKETQPLAQQELGNANIQSAILSGTIDINGAQIDVWDVTVKPNCRLHIARQAIRDCFRSYTEHYSGAFFIFHYENCANQPWRLSWLSLGKNNQDVNNAKRYTYLCGNDYACRTIAERFVELETTKTKTLDSITRAFDVEALSDEFFSEYRVLYNDIVQYITGQRYIKKNNMWECYPKKVSQDAPGYDIYLQFAGLYDNNEEQAVKAVRDYVKKLMGRLVFIQFVQKKNWLKINDISTTNFLLDIFNAVESEYRDDFIESVLEKVVYMLLNQEHTDYGKIGNVEIDVPFLNGGLFEPDIYDAGTKVRLPKEFFHNPQYVEVKRKLSDSQLRAEDEFFSQCGILDLFYQYNFTIDENDPNDAEIGVDPEMLGKIFENLLEDNKDKGAFYTPKEIVNYMCEESLIAYLNTKVPGIEDAIRQWVTANENSDAINMHQEALQDALREVKICDPAVGSGAFPMGLLNLLLRLRGTTHMTEAERCEIKKEIIQNNIYGVDIEKGAVDIARLRFWLSIVVDLDNPTALPNMDFKIMQGNSLLEWYEGVDLSGMSLNEQAKKKTKKGQAYEQAFIFDEQQPLDNIQNVIREYYGTDDHQKKVKLRGIINSNVKSYIRNLKGCTPEIQQKLETLPIPNDKFFLWHIYFKEVFDNGGFDIIIGNPPYISYYSRQAVYIDPNILKTLVKHSQFVEGGKQSSKGRFHSVQFFIDRGWRLLCEQGILSYIIDFSFFEKPFNRIRKYILENCHIMEIVSGLKEFKNVTSGQLILTLDHVNNKPTKWKESITGNVQEIDQSIWNKDGYIIKKDDENIVIKKIEKNSFTPLCKLGRLSQGVNIGGVAKKMFLSENPNKNYKYINGAQNVKAYNIVWPSEQQKNDPSTMYFNFDKSIERNIIQNNLMKGTPGIGKDNNRFIRPKIVIRQSDVRITAAIDIDKQFHCGYSLFVFNVEKDNEEQMYVLLGILNSKLITYFALHKGYIKIAKGKTPQIRTCIKNLPIADIRNEQKSQSISEKVKKILNNNQHHKSNYMLENEIDRIVYELYELTNQEVLLIDPTEKVI